MKVIVKGQIIETGFILTIDKIWNTNNGCAGKFFIGMEIYIQTVFGVEINIPIGNCTDEFYDKKEVEHQLHEIENEADKIIKFLEDHSDKPNWPYPVIE